MVDFSGAWRGRRAAFLVFFGDQKKHQHLRGFLRGFFGTPGILGGMREGSLRPKRPLGMALGHGNGKQAEGSARPGPEGGRIVYASRIPPRPLEAWRRG